MNIKVRGKVNMMVIELGIILIFIGSSTGTEQTCNYSTTKVVRLCDSTTLENQSHVYFDFTTFNDTLKNSCSCILSVQPGTKVNFVPQGNSSKPGYGCGVNILLEDGSLNTRFGCFSSNFSRVINSTVINITIYEEKFYSSRNADYACYSISTENNSLFNVNCGDGLATTPAVKTKSTNGMSSIPSTLRTTELTQTDTKPTVSSATEPVLRTDTTQSLLSTVESTNGTSTVPTITEPVMGTSTKFAATTTQTTSRTTTTLKPTIAESTIGKDITPTTAPNNRSVVKLEKSDPIDVTSWHIVIPVVVGIFLLLVIAATIPIIMHFRYREKTKQQNYHNQKIEADLATNHTFGIHTENPLYKPDEISVEKVSIDSGGHYASAEIKTSSDTKENCTQQSEGLPADDGHYSSMKYPESNVSSQRSDDGKQQSNGAVPVYAVVEKHKKTLDDTDDLSTSKVSSSSSSKTPSEDEEGENSTEQASSSPIYAVPDKTKKGKATGLHKSVISVSFNDSKTEYY